MPTDFGNGGAAVASEGLERGQIEARFGRIYALTLVGDEGCDDKEGCPIVLGSGDEGFLVARLREHELVSKSCVGNKQGQ